MRAKYFSKLNQVARLLRETIYLFPPNNIRAVFGDFRHMLPPYDPYSEYNILKVADWSALKRLASFLADGLLPWYKVKEAAKNAVLEPQERIEKPVGSFARAESIIHSEDPTCFLTEEGKQFPGEEWIYLNGIITDHHVAMMNGKYLAALFGRQIEVIHNPTDALLGDLIETIAGRLWQALSKADQFAYEYVLTALQKPEIKKVVFIAHSQGTVIAANILTLLRERHADLLSKLEIYTIANCASFMEIQYDENGVPAPYIEHFANTHDIICKLGITAKAAQKRGDVRLDGPVFTREAWGHLLNTHYLTGIEQKEYQDPEGLATPRLYEYLGGKVPNK